MKSNFQSNFLKYILAQVDRTLLELGNIDLKEFGIAVEFETQCRSFCMQNESLAAIELKKYQD